jgi:competence protein ComEA
LRLISGLNRLRLFHRLLPAVEVIACREKPMFMRIPSFRILVLGLAMLLAGSLLFAGPVNINTADAATLSRELKGIGMKRAQSIVEYRQKHGPFKSAEELALVKGIGPAAIAKNRDLIRIDVGQTPKGAQNPPAKAPARR